MKAAVATAGGLELRDDVPKPSPEPNEVLVRVRAAGLNRADLGTARAVARGEVAATIGLEWSGEVVEVGSQVTHIAPGDRVACSGAGGYAEFAICDSGRVIKIPGNMDFEKAAIVPIALYTLHNALITAARMRPGDSVLILGASTGVGLMGLQIAKRMGAKVVIGTSTNDARRARLGEFGADLALDTRDAGWMDRVLEATDGEGVNVVVDMISGPLVTQAMQAMAVLGRMVNVGRLGGRTASFDFDVHAARRIDYIGVTFRSRSIEEVREIARLAQADLWEAVVSGELSLPIDRSFAFDQAAEAQAYMAANRHFGKITLLM